MELILDPPMPTDEIEETRGRDRRLQAGDEVAKLVAGQATAARDALDFAVLVSTQRGTRARRSRPRSDGIHGLDFGPSYGESRLR
jgi:hypothetical protein